MINQSRAFNRYTTAKHTLELYIPGYYDTENNWVGESYSPPKQIRCTPIAYGDRDSGTNGQQLKATEIGQKILHSQEVPQWSQATVMAVPSECYITETIWVIDSGDYQTMLFPEDY